jgi:hypothetical protein
LSCCLLAAGTVLCFALSGVAAASAFPPPFPKGTDRSLVSDAPIDAVSLIGHQHGSAEGHLLPVQRNVRLISKLEPTAPFGDILPGQIADLAVHGTTAYLNSWQDPNCERGGTYVVDMKRPRRPRELTFIPALPGNYHGEGAQVVDVETTFFEGDLLAVNNEFCADTPRGGGFDLYDVSDPAHPKTLVQGFGDFGPEGTLTGDATAAHDSHNIRVWQDGEKLYAVIVDNLELHDVDFFDITDPRNPELIAETGIGDWPSVQVNAFGNFPTSHDFDVRFIGGHWLAMVSYWDAGWVLLNVDDPSNPTLIGDFDYAPCEAHMPTVCPPEGEAHQGEWNEDGSLFIGTDEDLAPFRLIFEIVGGPAAGEYDAEEFSWTIPISTLADKRVNGPVVFGGYGCPGDRASVPPASVLDPVTAPGEDQIVMFQRGPVEDPNSPGESCFFSEKVESAQLAGYDSVLIANHHVGASEGTHPHATLCGSQGHTFTVTIPGLCVGHELMHTLFGRAPDYTVPYPVGDPGDREPDIGDIGSGKVDATSFFSGWGHSRLLDADTLAELDQFWIDEANDPAFAVGFGDVDVHEVATGRGPDADLAYYAHYSGGIRVTSISPTAIEEVGRFIDQGGNDLWGVQLTEKFVNDARVVAFSDRDYGLYLASYTGP